MVLGTDGWFAFLKKSVDAKQRVVFRQSKVQEVNNM